MPPFIQKLSRSFLNTLFNVWTLFKALLSLRSPDPFPFRATSTMMVHLTGEDLENGFSSIEDGQNTTAAAPPSLTPSELLTISERAIQRAKDQDAYRQDMLRFSPAFLPPKPLLESGSNVNNRTVVSASPSSQLLESSSVTYRSTRDDDSPIPTITTPSDADFSMDRGSSDSAHDPFLYATPTLVDDDKFHEPQNKGPFIFTLPLCESTPPRSRMHGQTHKRTVLKTIFNFESLNIPTNYIVSLPSPTLTEPIVDTPVMQRQRSPSLRRKPAYDDLHSASPICAPDKYGLSSNAMGSSQELRFADVSPLRIVKRNGAKPPPDVDIRASTNSEVSKAVISAVMNTFTEIRENDSDITGTAARELINRESIQTCDGVITTPSKDDIRAGYEADESDEEYSDEAEPRPQYSPPPPYAFFNHGAIALKPGAVRAKTKKRPRRSTIEHSSPEAFYVRSHGTISASSVDSCLDDILESFEHLMSTMPKFRASLAKSRDSALPMIDNEDKDACRGLKEDGSDQKNVLEGSPQWSDVLRLENY